MIELLQAIYNKAKGTPSIVAAFPGFTRAATGTVYPVGFYAGQAADGAPLPYVVTSVIAAPSTFAYSTAERVEPAIQFAAYGVGHDATYAKLKTATDVFDTGVLALSTGQNYYAQRSGRPIPTWQELDADGNDVWQWAVTYDFALRY